MDELNISPTDSEKMPAVNRSPFTKKIEKAIVTNNSLWLLILLYEIAEMANSMKEKPINPTLKNISALLKLTPSC